MTVQESVSHAVRHWQALGSVRLRTPSTMFPSEIASAVRVSGYSFLKTSSVPSRCFSMSASAIARGPYCLPAECSLRLHNILTVVEHVATNVKLDLMPAKALCMAPNLKTVACASSPLFCADVLN